MKCYLRLWGGIAVAVIALAAGPASADDRFDFLRAAQFDDVPTVQRLLPVLGPNLRDEQRGENGLILALRENAMGVFKVLLAAPGIDVELRANNGNTALMMAAYKGNIAAVQALLDQGARVNQAGWTPLHYAAAGGDADIVRLLARHRAELDARTPAMLTALMVAAREGKEDAVAALLDSGADPALKSGEGLTAADMAERADKPYIVTAIAEHIAKAISRK